MQRATPLLLFVGGLLGCSGPLVAPPDALVRLPGERCVAVLPAPSPSQVDGRELRRADVPAAVLDWVRSLGCPGRTEDIEVLLEGARLDDTGTLRFSPGAHAAALADLAALAPACAAAASESPLVEPLVARRECPLLSILPPVGGAWSDFAVLWDLRRLLLELDLEGGSAEIAETAVSTLVLVSAFDPTTSPAGSARPGALGPLVDLWHARFSVDRLREAGDLADLCELLDSEGHVLELDGAALLRGVRTPRDASEPISLGYELSGYLEALNELSWTARERAEVRPWAHCDEACRAEWHALATRLEAELARVCPG